MSRPRLASWRSTVGNPSRRTRWRRSPASVGSLYQYFPNKLARAEAIRQHQLDGVLAALSDDEATGGRSTPARRVARLVAGAIAAHSVDPALRRILLTEVPLKDRSHHDAFEREYQRRYRAVLAAGPGERDELRDEMAARVMARLARHS